MSEVVEIGAIRARVTADVSQYTSGIDRAKAKTAELGKSANDASNTFRDLGSKLSALGASASQIDKINQAIRKANPELLRKQVAEVTDELTKLGMSSKEIEKVTKGLEKGAVGASGMSRELQALGGAYAGLAIAMGAIITKSVQTAAEFEQALANVKAISQATGEELAQMRDQAIKLGAATVYSASQAADAMANLAQAGFKTNDIIAAMPGVLSLAAAGQTDLATTAEITASILNGFQISTEETSRVVDVLAKASIDTNAGITDLGLAMKYLGPVAQNMGISVEEATAAVGELSNAGIKGEQAGTSLRAMLLQLASPSKEAAFYMERLGVSIKDSAGNILPLSNIIGQMEGAFRRLTQAQQADVAATLVGQEASSGFLALISQGKTQLDEYTVSLQNAGGTAEEVAGVQMDTLKGSIDNLQSALESAGITIGDKFAPAIRGAAEFVTKAVTAFTNLNPTMQSAILAFGTATAGALGLAAAIGALALAFKGLSVSFPVILAVSVAIGAVTAGVAALVAHSNEAAEAVKRHDDAQKSLNDTLNKSPLSNTAADIEKMQEKIDEATKAVDAYKAAQEQLAEAEKARANGDKDWQVSTYLIQQAKDALEEAGKALKDIGYDNVEDATAKIDQMNRTIKQSTPALLEMRQAEIADLAAKNDKMKSIEQLLNTYKTLTSAQKLNAAQEQEVASTTEALRKQYPDLIAKIDENGRVRIQNIGLIETQINAERSHLNESLNAESQRIKALKATAEAQKASIAAQIKNLEALARAQNAIIGRQNVNPIDELNAEKISMRTGQRLNTAYSDLYAAQANVNEISRQLDSLSSGNFGGIKTTGAGVDLTKPEKVKTPKQKKAKTGKTPEELAADARKKAFDADMATVRYQAEMYDWSADQQIAAYKKVQAAHKKYLAENIEDQRSLNLQLKNLAEDSAKARYDASSEWIKKEERRMEDSGKNEVEIAQMKLDAWTRVLKKYKKDSDEYKQADEEVYQARKELADAQKNEAKRQFDASSDWIDAEERRMQDAGKSEREVAQMKLEAWTRVRDRYTKDSELYKKADEEVYQARKAFTEKTISLAESLVKAEKSAIAEAKKADLDAIEARKKAALDSYDAQIDAIDELIKKGDELNSDADYETQLAEKRARVDLLASAVGPEGIQEREDLLKEIERMQLEHDRDMHKRDLEAQKDALQDEKDAQSKAFDDEKAAAEAQYDALTSAFEDYSGNIQGIESAIAEFRISKSAEANTEILSGLDAFIAQYNAKMASVAKLQSSDELAEYNANKDAWNAAKARGDSSEMARLSARNDELRKKYGITQDTGKLQSFKDGGIIKGASGSAVLVQAHAGEIVLNPQQQAALWDTIMTPSTAQPNANPAPTQIINHIDMSVNDVELTDKTDIQMLYNERERVATRLQSQGVKIR